MAHIAMIACTAAAMSLIFAVALVATTAHHGRFSLDTPVGVQKFHHQPVPRIGGLSIYLGLWVAQFALADAQARDILNTLLIAGAPALLAGLTEDFTKLVSVRVRLVATAISGALACWIGETAIRQIGVPPLDWLLQSPTLAVLFTAFAIAGVANAINIIDGFNGLASGSTVIALAALGTIAHIEGDTSLVLATIVLGGCVVGFGLVNFPWGKLFLGDGGAYFLGFALAWIAVLLPARNPDVSPWASLLACAYPVIEVLYSIVRRHLRRRPVSQADRGHLHSMVAMKVVQPNAGRLPADLQNAAVSVLMWGFAALPASAAVLYRKDTLALIVSLAVAAVIYHWIYRTVTRN